MADYSSYPTRGDRYDHAPATGQREDYGRNDLPYDKDSSEYPSYESKLRDPPPGGRMNDPRDRAERYDDYYEPPPPPIGEAARDPYAAGPPLPAYQQRDLPPREPDVSGINQLAIYNEEKAYAEYNRGEEEREAYYARSPPSEYSRRPLPLDDYDRPPPSEYNRRAPPRGDYDRSPPRRYTDERDRGVERRDERRRDEKHKDIAGTLIGGGAGALLGHELIGKGPLGTIGGAVVGAIAAKGMENYEDKKRREKDEERRRIRRDYDSEAYDPRGSYRSSNFYDSQHASPAVGAQDPGRLPPRRAGPRRHRKKPSSSSDSFTSDD